MGHCLYRNLLINWEKFQNRQKNYHLTTMKTLWHISRVLLGLVFMFSGFVKGVDPWGTAYKFADYFNAWGMERLSPFALTFGILLIIAEFSIGTALIFDVFISFFSLTALLFIIFFTGITLIIAISNPVSDCGCFGDAIILTNWETFYKNIFLILLALIVFSLRNRFKPTKQPVVPATLNGIMIVAFAYLINYSFNHLPVIDFRPYKIGTNIPEAMAIPENAARDIYKNTFVYKNKNTGEEKDFTEENYPWKDSLNWQFVSMDSKLIRKGYEPPIHNFIIESADGEDVKDFYLYDKGYTFILVVYNQDKVDPAAMPAIKKLAEYAINHNMNFIGLTSAIQEKTEQFKEKNGLSFDFFNGDEITLKTMIRSNPGLILLKNGTILGKWHYHDIPSPQKLEQELGKLQLRTNE